MCYVYYEALWTENNNQANFVLKHYKDYQHYHPALYFTVREVCLRHLQEVTGGGGLIVALLGSSTPGLPHLSHLPRPPDWQDCSGQVRGKIWRKGINLALLICLSILTWTVPSHKTTERNNKKASRASRKDRAAEEPPAEHSQELH